MYSYIIFIALFVNCNAAATHSHSSKLNKEREADGAYSPRMKTSASREHEHEFVHESILGSAKEAGEFDTLSPDESKLRLRLLLTKMDVDKDMNIDRGELVAWIMKSFKSLSEEEAKESLDEVDDNGDGKVGWDEYKSNTYDSEESDSELDNTELIEEDRFMWLAADWNNDGILEGEEWQAFSHPEEHAKMLPIILSQTLKQKDTNDDEKISFQEYIGDMAEHKNIEWLQSEKEKFDSELDKNGDGVLTGNEIVSWVVPNNREIAEEEVDHLFAASDDDHDDFLSFDEIIEHHDIFVGSEATDYGDHLHKLHHFEDEL